MNNSDYLDFERPIAELEAKIDELRLVENDSDVNLSEAIDNLQRKSDDLTKEIFSNLNAWQIAQIARHPKRPYTLDYIKHIFSDFDELHGDRHFADDQALVGGIARLEDFPVMVIGHQKGREVSEKVARNFGMPKPEGYRKACRLMQLAERYKMPIITFIDTPGAYPGIGAEERGQSEAIAYNLEVMSALKTPIVTVVIGEGGSGGALAIGVCDYLMMLSYSTYSVISPEGCASILWKKADYANVAAEIMGITAPRLKQLNLIDEIIEEPLGGAHKDVNLTAKRIKQSLVLQLQSLNEVPLAKLVSNRYDRLKNIS